MLFEDLGGSKCRFILKGAILGPRQERDGAPKSSPASFGGRTFLASFFAITREGQNHQSSEPWGARGPRYHEKRVGDTSGLYSLTLA